LARHRQVVRRILAAYEAFEFHIVYHQLVQYCASDLSAFYFDALKDRLYCDAAKGPRRRGSQSVLYRIACDLTRLMAPLLPVTADEVWTLLPGVSSGTVHVERFPEAEASDETLLGTWETLSATRAVVTKALEEARAAGRIASSLEAQVRLRGGAAELAPLTRYDESGTIVFPGNLANLFIVSRVILETAEGPLSVDVTRAAGAKCERCWTYSEAAATAVPAICERCADVLGSR
jgi:isoleucyl-tRNA synthetase